MAWTEPKRKGSLCMAGDELIDSAAKFSWTPYQMLLISGLHTNVLMCQNGIKLECLE